KSGYIPPIKFIDSKLDEEMESAFGVSRYKWWVKLSKEKLQKKCEIQGEVMRLNFAICCISLTNFRQIKDYEQVSKFCFTEYKKNLNIAYTNWKNTLLSFTNRNDITKKSDELLLEINSLPDELKKLINQNKASSIIANA